MINIMEPPPTPLIAAVYVRKKRKRNSSTDDEHPSAPSSISNCSTPTKVVCCLKKKKKKESPISASAVGKEEVDNRGSHYCSVSNINPSSLASCSVYNGEHMSSQFEPVTPQKHINKRRQKKQQQQAEQRPRHVFRWPRACHSKKRTADNKYAREGALFSTMPRGPLQNQKRNEKGKNIQVYDTTPVPMKKRRRPRLKIRNLLMKVEDKEKWWEEHLGEVKSFVSCIHGIQGDRRFIPWKGSVVDSVVGAFLTQNVSDILSSSAFISLAARFPLHPKSDNKEQYKEEEINRFVVETEVSIEKLLIETRIGQGHTNLQTTEGNGSCSGSNSEAKEDRNTDMEASSLDHDALRCAKVSEIADAIMIRGQQNRLARRIKAFLNRTVKNHGSIDLEWLKKIHPDEAKEYLMSIYGLGVKSVECIRLLTLHQAAFPVDTNVGRIAVRLGWVPLKPVPEDDLLHLLTLYPVQKTIHKFIWPMLRKLDQVTLYELHCQMITFGKVFCTKIKPNCNACPMNAQCKYYASELASKTPTLPGTGGKAVVPPMLPIVAGSTGCEPVIEEPATPKNRCMKVVVHDIEDTFYKEELDEMPTIGYNFEKLLPDNNMSNALVTLTPEIASTSMSKLKNVTRLRTEHCVYELPKGHPLLEKLDVRLPDDPCPYLLAIWEPGERCRSWLKSGILCKEGRCHSCSSSIQETNSGTLLVPVKTTMKGRFPLNGTYFQVNEMFADHSSSIRPIPVPRAWLQNLEQKTIYFGTSVNSIYRGLSKEKIQLVFDKGYICVRGFDREKGVPRPLGAIWHTSKNQKQRINGG